MTEEAHIYSCEECDWTGTAKVMNGIKDVDERVAPGELMAAGCCPQCDALIGIADQEIPGYTIEATMRALRVWEPDAPDQALRMMIEAGRAYAYACSHVLQHCTQDPLAQITFRPIHDHAWKSIYAFTNQLEDELKRRAEKEREVNNG